MKFYYYEGSTRKGPVPSVKLKELARKGEITRATVLETELGTKFSAERIGAYLPGFSLDKEFAVSGCAPENPFPSEPDPESKTDRADGGADGAPASTDSSPFDVSPLVGYSSILDMGAVPGIDKTAGQKPLNFEKTPAPDSKNAVEPPSESRTPKKSASNGYSLSPDFGCSSRSSNLNAGASPSKGFASEPHGTSRPERHWNPNETFRVAGGSATDWDVNYNAPTKPKRKEPPKKTEQQLREEREEREERLRYMREIADEAIEGLESILSDIRAGKKEASKADIERMERELRDFRAVKNGVDPYPAPSGRVPSQTPPTAPSGRALNQTPPSAPSGRAPGQTPPAAPSGRAPNQTPPSAPSGRAPGQTPPAAPPDPRPAKKSAFANPPAASAVPPTRNQSAFANPPAASAVPPTRNQSASANPPAPPQPANTGARSGRAAPQPGGPAFEDELGESQAGSCLVVFLYFVMLLLLVPLEMGWFDSTFLATFLMVSLPVVGLIWIGCLLGTGRIGFSSPGKSNTQPLISAFQNKQQTSQSDVDYSLMKFFICVIVFFSVIFLIWSFT